jgi:hypothetical protein
VADATAPSHRRGPGLRGLRLRPALFWEILGVGAPGSANTQPTPGRARPAVMSGTSPRARRLPRRCGAMRLDALALGLIACAMERHRSQPIIRRSV